jgi:hypothetical protein
MSGWCCARDRTYRDDLPGALLLHNRRDRVAAIHGPEQVHFRHELQERRIKAAGLGVHRPTTTAPGIRNKDIHPTPFLDDTRDHRLDRLMSQAQGGRGTLCGPA